MVDIIKQDMTDIWAVAGDVVAPDSSKVRAGWGVEVVPRQWWNWFENRQDTNIAYMLQKGIPEWDQFTEYLANKSYVQRNGVVYKCILTGVNKDPATVPANWTKAFPESTAYLEHVKSLPVTANTVTYTNASRVAAQVATATYGLSLLALTSSAAGRALLEAQQANSNLTALSGVSAATNILPYFTGTSAMAGTALTSYARSLLGQNDASSMRSTLGLTSAATTAVQTGPLDTTSGRILTVGAFGSGGKSLDLRSTIYVNGTPQDVFGTGTTFGFTNGGSGADPATTLSIPALSSGVAYGTLQVNAQHSDVSGLQSTSRVFTTGNGRVFTQVAASATTWGPWNESWNTDNLVKTTSTSDATVGRMLKVGDFGLGTTGPVNLNGTNAADSITIPTGFYEVNPTNTWESRPIAGTWTRIIHHAHNNPAGYATQYATAGFNTAGSSNRYFNRTLIAGVWSDWVEIYHSGNSGTLVSQVQAGIQPQLDSKQPNLGYIPVQQGTGTGQLTNTVKIGWGGLARLRLMVDNTDFAYQWPIDINGASSTASRWTTARTLSLSGDASGSVPFDGSSNANLVVTVLDDSHQHSISTVTGLQAALDSTIKRTGMQTISSDNGVISQPIAMGQLLLRPTTATGAGQAAALTFLRPGYGVNLGLSSTTAELVVGGYSMGTVEYPIVHTGNLKSKVAEFGFAGGGGQGYTTMPNGMIIQYGIFNGATGGTVNFPIAFPNECQSVVLTTRGKGLGCLDGKVPTKTSFSWYQASLPESIGINWIAIGY